MYNTRESIFYIRANIFCTITEILAERRKRNSVDLGRVQAWKLKGGGRLDRKNTRHGPVVVTESINVALNQSFQRVLIECRLDATRNKFIRGASKNEMIPCRVFRLCPSSRFSSFPCETRVDCNRWTLFMSPTRLTTPAGDMKRYALFVVYCTLCMEYVERVGHAGHNS